MPFCNQIQAWARRLSSRNAAEATLKVLVAQRKKTGKFQRSLLNSYADSQLACLAPYLSAYSPASNNDALLQAILSCTSAPSALPATVAAFRISPSSLRTAAPLPHRVSECLRHLSAESVVIARAPLSPASCILKLPIGQPASPFEWVSERYQICVAWKTVQHERQCRRGEGWDDGGDCAHMKQGFSGREE
jgi:hypothetical protein